MSKTKKEGEKRDSGALVTQTPSANWRRSSGRKLKLLDANPPQTTIRHVRPEGVTKKKKSRTSSLGSTVIEAGLVLPKPFL